MAVSLKQTTQIKLYVSFIPDLVAYFFTNKTKIASVNRDGTWDGTPSFFSIFFFFLSFLPGADASHVYVRAVASTVLEFD